jgi:hypothetical protein
MGFGPSIVVDDLDASMEYVRNYYRAIPAKHPDKTS